jgi:hypothetical protein
MADWFDKNSPSGGDWFDKNSPSANRPAGLPAGVDLPGLPAHPAVDMKPAPETPESRFLGSGNFGDTARVVGNHLANMVTTPYHAIVDPPKNAREAEEMGDRVPSALGHLGLGAARLLVNPTLDAGRQAIADFKSGDYNSAGQRAMDAIPIAGPWARSIENDAQAHGVLPALAGMATDIAAPGIASKGVGLVAKPLAAGAAVSDVTRMIRPSAADVGFGKEPAVGLLKQPGGIFALSKEGLLEKSRANLGKIGQQIGDEVSRAPQNPIDISREVTSPFDSSLSDAAKSNQTALFDRLKEVRKGLTTDLSYDPATESIQQRIGPKNLTAVTPSEVFSLKKRVGDNTKWTNQAFDNDVNATQGEVYGRLKDALNKAIPSLRPLNESYGNLRSGISALERRLPIEARNNAISLPDATISAGTAAATGIPQAAGALAVKKLLTSDPIRLGLDAKMWKYGNTPTAVLAPTAPGLILRAVSQKKDQ